MLADYVSVVSSICSDCYFFIFFFLNDPPPPEISPLPLHDALPICIHAVRDFLYALLFGSLPWVACHGFWVVGLAVVIVAEIVLTMWDFVVEIRVRKPIGDVFAGERSEEHTSELQSLAYLVCRLLLE